jgi:D-tyrosyl-tRNA(Tyr) deacylase
VTRTKAGYCQHFAGAMALMLRLLGVPARVAVGFTSGTRRDGAWVVTDHDAHAWVEVWFAGEGWVPFDPTPGRGTLGGDYSFASGSREAVAALRRGELTAEVPPRRSRVPDVSDLGVTSQVRSDRAPWLVGIGLLLALVWMLGVGLGKAVRRRFRYLSRDPRRVASASRQELEGFLRDQGAAVEPNATLADLQRAVREELALGRRCVRHGSSTRALRATGHGRIGREDCARGAPATPPLARRDLSIWARLRGFVSLRHCARPARCERDLRLFQLGRSHLRNGMPAQATVPLEKAKRAEPTSRSIREALGIAYFRIRRWEEAEAEFRALRRARSIRRVRPSRPRARAREPGPARGGDATPQARAVAAAAHRGRRHARVAVRAVVQRVSEASVSVGDDVVDAIGRGGAVLLGVASNDTSDDADRLAGKLARLRIFENEDGRFDRSLVDVDGEVLVVSQFTLIADTRKGNRRASPLRETRAGRAALRTLLRGAAKTRASGRAGRVRRADGGCARQRRAGHDRAGRRSRTRRV